MDEYYTLTFFGYPDAGKYIIEDLQQFMCPEHYETIEDARLVAEYWMRYGFFRGVRCDKRAESLDGAPNLTKYGAFYAQKLDGRIAWRDSREQTGDITYTETTHEVVWKCELRELRRQSFLKGRNGHESSEAQGRPVVQMRAIRGVA